VSDQLHVPRTWNMKLTTHLLLVTALSFTPMASYIQVDPSPLLFHIYKDIYRDSSVLELWNLSVFKTMKSDTRNVSVNIWWFWLIKFIPLYDCVSMEVILNSWLRMCVCAACKFLYLIPWYTYFQGYSSWKCNKRDSSLLPVMHYCNIKTWTKRRQFPASVVLELAGGSKRNWCLHPTAFERL
jgi:hypothetical protein